MLIFVPIVLIPFALVIVEYLNPNFFEKVIGGAFTTKTTPPVNQNPPAP